MLEGETITVIGLEGYREGWWKARRENDEVKNFLDDNNTSL